MSTITGGSGLRARRKEHAASHERWLVSYADFMTLLFAFFVVLFASSRHNGSSLHKVAGSIRNGFSQMSVTPEEPMNSVPPPGPKPAAAPHVDLTRLRQQLQEVLGDSIARHEIVLEQTPDGLVISLRELGFFNSGQARVLPGAADKIKRAARVLVQHDVQIKVEGHSDDQPIHNSIFHSNWELSAARAMTVLALLVDQGGMDPGKVSLGAYGSYHALASNSTEEGRRINRRVDLVVVAPVTPLAPGTPPARERAGPVAR